MLNLIPIQYRALAALLLALSLLSGGFYAGHRWASTKAEAARAKLVDTQVKQLHAETRRADAASAALSVAEARVITKTVEVIKYVPSVTTGTVHCLSGAAVSLLQPGSGGGPQPAAVQLVAESPANLAASDRDVAYWIADANRLYEVCAERINGAVDYYAEDGKPDLER